MLRDLIFVSIVLSMTAYAHVHKADIMHFIYISEEQVVIQP